MPPKPKLALLCDYGLDDAIATVYLLNHADQFEMIDILPIGGNFPVQTTMDNARRLLACYPGKLSNVRLVDTRDFIQPSDCLPEIHGGDGMGNVLPKQVPMDLPLIPYRKWISDLPPGYSIISLGPCTVTENIMVRKDSIATLIMGGNINQTPNFGEYEFNEGKDPVAFNYCVTKAQVVATMDSCHHPLCDFYKIPLTGDDLLTKLIRRAVVLSRLRHEDACYIYDLIAVACLIQPQKFDIQYATDKRGRRIPMLRYIADTPIL